MAEGENVLRDEEMFHITTGVGDDRETTRMPAYRPGPGGALAPEIVVARAMWDMDVTRKPEAAAWPDYRSVLSYAGQAIHALREAGYLEGLPREPSRPRFRASPIPRFSSEAELRDKALDQLRPHFAAQIEVWGTHCSGRRLRLDAVLRPRDPGEWKDESPVFGVEFKIAHQQPDLKNMFDWVRQAVDYTHVDWDGFGRLPIFTCPSPVRGTGDSGSDVLPHLLGRFGVGELAPLDGQGWSLLIHGDHLLWSERRGVVEAKRASLVPKVGNA